MFKLSLQIGYITFLLFFKKNDENSKNICYNNCNTKKTEVYQMRFSKKQLRIICAVLACAIAVPMILVVFELLK